VDFHQDRSRKIRKIGATPSYLYLERGEYRAKPAWKAASIAGNVRFRKSEKGKAIHKRSLKLCLKRERGKAYQKQNDKGKEFNRREKNEKSKAEAAKFLQELVDSG
jgi:hypothetical protein